MHAHPRTSDPTTARPNQQPPPLLPTCPGARHDQSAEPSGAADTTTGPGRLRPPPTHQVATEHPHQWVASGIPDSLADPHEPLELVWAGMRLASEGADQHTLARTLGLTEDTALRLIVATTEALLAPPPTGEG